MSNVGSVFGRRRGKDIDGLIYFLFNIKYKQIKNRVKGPCFVYLMINQDLFKNKYRIQSARLYGYNYSWPGFYFITICTKDRVNYFGEISDRKIQLTKIGRMAQKYWLEIPVHFPFVRLDEFIVMPNHIHGIIIITGVETQNPNRVETQNLASLRRPDFVQNVETQNLASLRRPDFVQNVETQDFASLPINKNSLRHHNKFVPQSRNLPSIIRGFKIGVKKCAKKNNIEFSWQEKFYDRIIRNENELNYIRQYIIDNPKNCDKDKNNLSSV